MDTMQLGGNIELSGFSELDKAQLVVLKKIVGNYAREFFEKTNFEKLILSMSKEGNKYKIVAELKCEKPVKSEAKDNNLFFVVGNVLENIGKEL